MNIESYNLDSLRELVRTLQAENKGLRALHEKSNIPYAESKAFSRRALESKEYDLDQETRIIKQYIDRGRDLPKSGRGYRMKCDRRRFLVYHNETGYFLRQS